MKQIPGYVSVERLIQERTRCGHAADVALTVGHEAERCRWNRAWRVLNELIYEATSVQEKPEKPQ